MISIQNNVDSLNAQRNLGVDNKFQSKTIEQLSTGYRINSSGDDAAGLAIANGYRSSVTELTQGVSNANDGTSQLQIVDGGISNISTILDRLKTLATQSASSTFTGDRGTLNTEYSQLLTEIDRQASNVNLNAGGSFNTNLSVYIGGGSTAANASVNIDLSGSSNAVDSTSLGLASSNVLSGGVGIAGNTKRLDAPGATFTGDAFTFNVNTGSGATTLTTTASAAGSSATKILSDLNAQINSSGITASLDSGGKLQFTGASAFNVHDAGTNLVTAAGSATNTSNYEANGSNAYTAAAENLTFQTSKGNVTVALLASDNIDSAIAKINAQTQSSGVLAIKDATGSDIEFQSANSFSVSTDGGAAGALGAAANIVVNSTAPVTGSSSNGSAAILAIDAAIKTIGLVQGQLGAGENKLQYAINLAQSQISSFSTAESQIRDADVAAQAANLTKAQVLTQTSVAALAQANSEPQAIMKLLQ